MSVEGSGDGEGSGGECLDNYEAYTYEIEGSGGIETLSACRYVPECIDIDECSRDEGLCRNGFCTNTLGGYYCTCDAGYKNDFIRCQEIDYDGPYGFDFSYGLEYPHQECELWETCMNKDECADGSDNCPISTQCFDREPFFQCCSYNGRSCSCPSGYVLANRHGKFGQSSNQRCLPIVCNEGHTINEEGRICIDDDECILGTHSCDTQSETCINNEGSYTCEPCPIGYEPFVPEGSGEEGDPATGTCVDINECELESTPSCIQGTCLNTEGTYTCDCLPGFEIESQRCSYPDLDGPYGNEYPHEACTYHPTCKH